ncbi:hypothetical protein AMECASPLE_039088 [Ameca splendens]|uniref:Uncharacterized protein n=1 Tax=Ameca splendens TaxID=208324 RepID=A0ABV0YKG6_9TELE
MNIIFSKPFHCSSLSCLKVSIHLPINFNMPIEVKHPRRMMFFGKLQTQLLLTDFSAKSLDLCRSFRLALGLLAAFLINILFAQPVSLGGPPCLGKFSVDLRHSEFGILF